MLNPSDSMIPAVIHTLINVGVIYMMYTYPLEESWLFVYIFVMQLGKITKIVGKH